MSVTDALVLLLSVSSMLSAGLAAGQSARRPPARGWRGAAVLVANLFVLPLVALIACSAAGLGPASLGVMLAAAAPGGSSGPLLAGLAGGEPRVAMRLFLMLTFAGTATALIVVGAADAGGLVAVARAATVVTVVSVVPLVTAYGIAARKPQLDPRIAAWLGRVSALLLLVAIGLLAVRDGDQASLSAMAVSVPVVALSLAVGLLVQGRAEAVATAQVSAVRNLTLGLVVLAALGAPPAATAALLTYGLVMYAGAGILAAFARYSARVAT